MLFIAARAAFLEGGRGAKGDLRGRDHFQAATIALVARKWLGSLDSFEAWFTHAEPADLSVYRSIFGAAPLHFAAPQDAVSFDRALLEVPMKTADPKLNAVLRRHAEHLISELPEPSWLTGKVRQLLLNLLPAGHSNADYLAARLGMSRRTLTRRLERHGGRSRAPSGVGLARALPSIDARAAPSSALTCSSRGRFAFASHGTGRSLKSWTRYSRSRWSRAGSSR